jgi:hypothetical protein
MASTHEAGSREVRDAMLGSGRAIVTQQQPDVLEELAGTLADA